MRIALLAHKTGNIGHLFMAEGMKNIILKAFGNSTEIIEFEQHRPLCIYNEYLPILNKIKAGNRLNLLKKVLNNENISLLIWKIATNHLKKYDLAISVGGPSIVNRVYKSGDMQLMLHHMLGAFYYNKIKVFNFSNGSCFPLEDIPQNLDEKDILFWQRSLKYSYIITFRDELAKKFLQPIIKYDAPLLPCPAVLSMDTFKQIGEKKEEYIIINYQKKGANEDWGQNVNEERWKSTIKQVINRLKKRHKIIMLCHNKIEEQIANRLNIPDIEIIYPKTIEEYSKVALSAKVGLVSRLHAAISLAGMGVPSIVIGTDTRLFTAKLLGLNTIYVKDATVENLVDKLNFLMNNSKNEHDRLIALREDTMKRYCVILQETYG